MTWCRSNNFLAFSRYLILVLLLVSFSLPYSTQGSLPVTGRDISSLISVIHLPPPTIDSWTSREQLPSLNNFVNNLADGQTGAVRGVYIPGFMALPIVQQPRGDTGFVSVQPGTATQFQLAAMILVILVYASTLLQLAVSRMLMEHLVLAGKIVWVQQALLLVKRIFSLQKQ